MFTALGKIVIGKMPTGGFMGGESSDSFFVLLSVESGLDEVAGATTLASIKDALTTNNIHNLKDFENAVSSSIMQNNLPAHFDLVVGYILENVLYVKTVGNGTVLYRRGSALDELMTGNKTASGELVDGDLLICTTQGAKSTAHGLDGFKTLVQKSKQDEILQKIQEKELSTKEGFVAQVVQFSKSTESLAQPVIPAAPSQTGADLSVQNVSPAQQQPATPSSVGGSVLPQPTIPQAAAPQTLPVQEPVTPDMPSRKGRFSFSGFSIKELLHSRVFIIVIAVVLVGVLVWSVVFGYQRRQAAQLNEHIATVKEEIDGLLQEAEDIATLDTEQATVIITEAKNKYTALSTELKNKNKDSQLKDIQDSIDAIESKIVKREEKQFDEFYDLALEDENATMQDVFVSDGEAALLDANNGRVYILSLDSKSIEKYVSPDIAEATAVALYGGKVYVFHPKKGVLRFTSTSKVESLVAPDDEWGTIRDFAVYSGNLYLLDSTSDEVYKYLVAEGGFSDKRSYFGAGESIDLGSADRMAIDGSIFISLGSSIAKYTQGVRDQFNPNLPTESPSISILYTDVDEDHVYMLDKKVATVYISDKEETFQKQIQTKFAKEATGMFVYNNALFISTGSKIYSTSLE